MGEEKNMYSWLKLSKKIENYVRWPERSAAEKGRVEILLEFEKFPTDYDMCMISLMITHLHISADANVRLMTLNTHFLTSLANPADSKLKGIAAELSEKVFRCISWTRSAIIQREKRETHRTAEKGLLVEWKVSRNVQERKSSKLAYYSVKAGKTSNKAHDFQWAVKKVVPLLY